MSVRLRSIIGSLLILASLSGVANAFLVYEWRTERQNYRDLLQTKDTQIQTTGQKNRKLSKENQTFQTEIVTKDQELNKKIADLTALTTQFDAKKKELDDKVASLAKAQQQIDDQKSQLDANSSELSKLRGRPPLFSFQNKSTGLQDVEAKKAAVKQVVSDAYDTIESIYGTPYLLHSVTITFVDSFQNDKASGEIVITNSSSGLDYDIHIKDFDRNSFADDNTIIHEVIHSFHGLSALAPTAFEEGITVAATDVVMKKMIAAGKLPSFNPLYIRLSDADFASKQASFSIPRDDAAFYGTESVAEFYQILGKAWYNLYGADQDFFKKFNEIIYAAKNGGQEITEQLVLDTIRSVQSGANLSGAAWQLK